MDTVKKAIEILLPGLSKSGKNLSQKQFQLDQYIVQMFWNKLGIYVLFLFYFGPVELGLHLKPTRSTTKLRIGLFFYSLFYEHVLRFLMGLLHWEEDLYL